MRVMHTSCGTGKRGSSGRFTGTPVRRIEDGEQVLRPHLFFGRGDVSPVLRSHLFVRQQGRRQVFGHTCLSDRVYRKECLLTPVSSMKDVSKVSEHTFSSKARTRCRSSGTSVRGIEGAWIRCFARTGAIGGRTYLSYFVHTCTDGEGGGCRGWTLDVVEGRSSRATWPCTTGTPTGGPPLWQQSTCPAVRHGSFLSLVYSDSSDRPFKEWL
ncbi:hypothetical protein M011DRAFT_290787 [Sporormia fimetaria CBS 119925]|uniref:Uncharacterized protein n=1 Tax=Sporormia fimetaria CBS 119925 TaxID=1340428 RepID=A0A6A6UX83_9PLEO|nr:hypothetical protein M011DRAFT_290787 [Sporormia fimetaria CBS 119925]